MPPETVTAPDRSRQPDPDRDPDGPPEEEFWEKYNKRLEFPFAAVGAILIHVAVAALLIFVLVKLMNKDGDRSAVPLTLVPDMAGVDEAGGGQAGSGGVQDPTKQNDPNPWKNEPDVLPDPAQLAQIKDTIRDQLKLEDVDGNIPISDANAAQYRSVDDELARKFLGVNRKGAGPGKGTGDDGSAGTGPGGTGAESTRAKSLRWVLRFRTASGEDYLAQLAAMRAVILVPLPPENKKCLYFTDLRNPRGTGRIATEADERSLSGQIKFGDTRPDSVRGVCDALGVRENAKSFWAFFPKEVESELSKKEIGYRNRRPENIEETVFRVIVKGGSYEAVVDDQTPKR